MVLLQQQVLSVKEMSNDFKLATKSIVNRSEIEQLNIAFQLGHITKDQLQVKFKSIMNL
jgi:hypothetical protein